MKKVDTDLKTKLCFKEFTLVEQRFPNIEQVFVPLKIAFSVFQAYSMSHKFSRGTIQISKWGIDGCLVWGLRHGD